jgi:hypothetical protein
MGCYQRVDAFERLFQGGAVFDARRKTEETSHEPRRARRKSFHGISGKTGARPDLGGLLRSDFGVVPEIGPAQWIAGCFKREVLREKSEEKKG